MDKLLKLFLIVTLGINGVIAGCNRDSKTQLENEWDVVAFGTEITWQDYAKWTLAAVADGFGCTGSCTTAILQSVITSITNEVIKQVEALGQDALLKLITSGGTLEVDSATLKGGILSYDCWIDDCNCCEWSCGQLLGIPCTGCSCKQCGSTRRDEPNHQQPYVAIRNKKSVQNPPQNPSQRATPVKCKLDSVECTTIESNRQLSTHTMTDSAIERCTVNIGQTCTYDTSRCTIYNNTCARYILCPPCHAVGSIEEAIKIKGDKNKEYPDEISCQCIYGVSK